MIPKRITKEWLEENDMGWRHIEAFSEIWPNGCALTIDNLAIATCERIYILTMLIDDVDKECFSFECPDEGRDEGCDVCTFCDEVTLATAISYVSAPPKGRGE